MTALGGNLFYQLSLRLTQTCFRRCIHGTAGVKSMPVTGIAQKKALPQVQPPSTWVLCSLSSESKSLRPPKPPMSAYLLFTMDKRPQLRNAQPDLPVTQIGKQLGQMWRELPEAEKQRYKDMYRVNREQYKEQYESFMSSLSAVEKSKLKTEMETRQKKLLALRKKRKLKSLDKPKRPMTAFLLYYKSQMEHRGTTPVTIFMKEIAREWQAMSETEKMPYLEKAKAERLKYETDLKAWENRMVAEGHPELVRGYKPQKVKKTARKVKKATAIRKKRSVTKRKKKATKKQVKSKKEASKKAHSSAKKTTNTKKKKASASSDESWMREE